LEVEESASLFASRTQEIKRFEGLTWESCSERPETPSTHRFADFAATLLHLAGYPSGSLAASICLFFFCSGAHYLVFVARSE
jgi:hypothetical protein